MKSFKTRLQELRFDVRQGRYKPPQNKGVYEDEGEYDRLVLKLDKEFREKLEKLFGMDAHAKRGLLWSLTEDYGRSGGHSGMIDVYLDLVELVKEETEDGSVQVAAPVGVKRRSRDAAVPHVQRGSKPAALRAKRVRAGRAQDRDDADRKVLRAGKGRGGQGRVGRSGQRQKLVKGKKS